MNPDAIALQDFLSALVKDASLFPIYDSKGNLVETFCNFGAMRNAPGEIFSEFPSGTNADQMFAIMDTNVSGKWKNVSGAEAQAHAAMGGRAHGALPSYILKQMHGHIVRICPIDMQQSGSLGRLVPMCANVGRGDMTKPLVKNNGGTQTRPNLICKTSEAFPVDIGECEYFTYGA